MTIKNKAILVSLSVSMWTNSVHDGSVVKDIVAKTHSDTDVHNYKKVLIKPEALAQVRSARIALRSHWWNNTLPWGAGGVRLLPSTKYQEFAEKLRELRGDYERAVADFAREYPKMKAESRKRLGSLFKDEDFPGIDHIRRKFGCAVDFAPIPDAEDFRVTLSEDERKEIFKEVERQVQENTKQAMAALVEKLQETVQNLTERLKADEPQLRRGLIENISEVCREVEAFNLIDDKKIEGFRKASSDLIKTVNLEELKGDRKKRKELATKADDILAKMAGYIGGDK